eukprot:scaffold67474_cov31-Prasinocladus_malaysianus.AAC.2
MPAVPVKSLALGMKVQKVLQHGPVDRDRSRGPQQLGLALRPKETSSGVVLLHSPADEMATKALLLDVLKHVVKSGMACAAAILQQNYIHVCHLLGQPRDNHRKESAEWRQSK